MVKLSIIIPYFKTYELTYKLLQKILEQLTNEVEILLIDDGCGEHRFDDLPIRCKNINVVHLNENVGCGMARNVGIKMSRGNYIAFIDSDDFITDDYIKTLINTIDNHNEDLIYFDWQDMNNGNIVKHPSNPAVWKCIYKKEIIPLFVEEKHFAHEDVPFTNGITNKQYSKYYIDKVLYLYNSNRIGGLTWNLENK